MTETGKQKNGRDWHYYGGTSSVLIAYLAVSYQNISIYSWGTEWF